MKKNKFNKIVTLVIVTILAFTLPTCSKKDASSNVDTTASVKDNSLNRTEALRTCVGTGNNHEITKELAKKMIDKYQLAVKNRTLASIVNNAWVLSESFTGDDVRRLMAQPNCCMFRIYYGLGVDNKIHAILVGTNSNGQDTLSYIPTTNNAEEPPPLILETSRPCAPFCDGNYLAG